MKPISSIIYPYWDSQPSLPTFVVFIVRRIFRRIYLAWKLRTAYGEWLKVSHVHLFFSGTYFTLAWFGSTKNTSFMTDSTCRPQPFQFFLPQVGQVYTLERSGIQRVQLDSTFEFGWSDLFVSRMSLEVAIYTYLSSGLWMDHPGGRRSTEILGWSQWRAERTSIAFETIIWSDHRWSLCSTRYTPYYSSTIITAYFE